MTESRETYDLIGSDKVEGTNVYGADGNKIGSIERVMIGKRSGKVDYAVLSFGGFLGIGDEHYPLPWASLKYNTELRLLIRGAVRLRRLVALHRAARVLLLHARQFLVRRYGIDQRKIFIGVRFRRTFDRIRLFRDFRRRLGWLDRFFCHATQRRHGRQVSMSLNCAGHC
jgi:hypothetical protein